MSTIIHLQFLSRITNKAKKLYVGKKYLQPLSQITMYRKLLCHIHSNNHVRFLTYNKCLVTNDNKKKLLHNIRKIKTAYDCYQIIRTHNYVNYKNFQNMRNDYFMQVWGEIGEYGKKWYFFLSVGRSEKMREEVGKCELG